MKFKYQSDNLWRIKNARKHCASTCGRRASFSLGYSLMMRAVGFWMLLKALRVSMMTLVWAAMRS